MELLIYLLEPSLIFSTNAGHAIGEKLHKPQVPESTEESGASAAPIQKLEIKELEP
jgi:hypothetical protein